MIPVLVGVSLVIFILLQLIPGDPISIYIVPGMTETQIEALRHEIGLDRPLWVQYSIWLGNVLQGDFGISTRSKRPVLFLIGQHLPATLELTVASLLIASVVGIFSGVVSALKRYTITDYVFTSLALFGISMPNFWFGILLIMLFSLYLGWLPASGYAPWSDGLLKHLSHLILPAITLGLFNAGALMRFTRSSMLKVISQDYIRTARAKGLMENVVIYRHALKNGLIPTLTFLGLQFGFLMAGAVIIEQVFAWPGIGRLTLTAILVRDYPLVMGIVLVIATIFVLSNLVVDVLYTWLDPRIRLK